MLPHQTSQVNGNFAPHLFAPSDAAQLNPHEFVWNNLKRQGVSKKPLLKNESLRQRVAGEFVV